MIIPPIFGDFAGFRVFFTSVNRLEDLDGDSKPSRIPLPQIWISYIVINGVGLIDTYILYGIYMVFSDGY